MNALRKIVPSLSGLLLLVSAASADPITFDYAISSTTAFNTNSTQPNSAPAGTWSYSIGPASGTWIYPFPSSREFPPVGAGTGSNYDVPPGTSLFANVPIALTVTLTDDTTKAVAGAIPTGTLTFAGYISGTVTSDGSGQYHDFTFAWNQGTESMTLGSPGQFHTFTVPAPNYYPTYWPNVDAMGFDITASDYVPGIGRRGAAGPARRSLQTPTTLAAGIAAGHFCGPASPVRHERGTASGDLSNPEPRRGDGSSTT
jgi:hypothetical protein